MNHIDDELIVSAEKGRIISKKPSWMKLGALAAAFVLIFTGVFAVLMSNTFAANTIVALDVNPSMEIEINKNEKIIEVRALNEDAEKILSELELKNVDLNTGVSAIIGAMVQNGYLTIDQNSILVSVKGDNKNSDALQKQISESIASLLGNKNIDASVITQPYDENKEAEQKAKENNISVAKATLIGRVLDAGITDSNGVPYTYEALAQMSINELKLLIESKALNVGGIDSTGHASSGKYISKDAAISSALTHAGFARDQISRLETEMDFEKGKMLYEIEFVFNGIEYDYEIDATDGTIIKSKQELVDKDDNDEVITEVPALDRNAAIDKALFDASLTRDQVRELEVELEKKNGVLIYEIDFETSKFEYEYKINATDGTIIKSEKEPND